MDGCRLVTVVTKVDYRSLMKPSNSRNAWVETTRFQYDRYLHSPALNGLRDVATAHSRVRDRRSRWSFQKGMGCGTVFSGRIASYQHREGRAAFAHDGKTLCHYTHLLEERFGCAHLYTVNDGPENVRKICRIRRHKIGGVAANSG